MNKNIYSFVNIVSTHKIKGLIFVTILGLLLGVISRISMRYIAFVKEFSIEGTLLILFVFTTFAFFQGLPLIITNKNYKNILNFFQVFSILFLASGQGAVMAPFIIFGGFALWYPLNKKLKLLFVILSIINVTYVGYQSLYVELFSKYPDSLVFMFYSQKRLLGGLGLLFVYCSVLWFLEGVFFNFSKVKLFSIDKNS